MKSIWSTIITVGVMLGLLVLLAVLQYRWLGQISDAERVRLVARLKDDTKRFSEDFNREISRTFFFSNSWDEIPQTLSGDYDKWKKGSSYPKLVKNLHFISSARDSAPLIYNKKREKFEETVWSDDLKRIHFASEKEIRQFSGRNMALVVPIYQSRRLFRKLFIAGKRNEMAKTLRNFKFPKKMGVMVISLNKEVITEEVLPALVQKYFPNDERAGYRVVVSDNRNKSVFQSDSKNFERSDAEENLFRLDTLYFRVSEEEDVDELGKKKPMRANISFNKRKIREFDFRISRSRWGVTSQPKGIWTLRVQHVSGSLEKFITSTRQRNMAISFGILTLLAVTMIMILISSQRARALAKRQVDFVSSVSHEFRTPLAVIYSAAENLSDGVIGDREKISKYGSLIKGEGKKLSGMVEQILEFAGASSGNHNYDFRDVEVGEVIENAIQEFEPLIKEKGFIVERQIAHNLPTILADEKALDQVLQNLIANSLKYCNGEKWLKVSARHTDNNLKITFEDRGIGISKKDRKQIFEPFFRGTNAVERQIGGNGLGLSLVKKIVEAHGGTISVASELGKGSVFSVILPVEV